MGQGKRENRAVSDCSRRRVAMHRCREEGYFGIQVLVFRLPQHNSHNYCCRACTHAQQSSDTTVPDDQALMLPHLACLGRARSFHKPPFGHGGYHVLMAPGARLLV